MAVLQGFSSSVQAQLQQGINIGDGKVKNSKKIQVLHHQRRQDNRIEDDGGIPRIKFNPQIPDTKISRKEYGIVVGAVHLHS